MINETEKFKSDIKKTLDYFNKGDFKLAINNAQLLLKKQPNNTFLHNLLGISFQKINQMEDAKNIFLNSLKIDKNNLATLNNLGNTLRKLGEFRLAEKYYKIALNENPEHINSLVSYGSLKYELNEHQDAIKLYKKALILNENIFQPNYNLALTYLSLGNFKNALNYFLKALKINPNFTAIDKLISRFTNYTNDNGHLKDMINKNHSLSLSEESKANLNFALGKAYEDIKDYKKSFEYLEIGNKAKKKSTNYNIKFDLKIFDALKNKFKDYNFKNNLNRYEDKKIIFILGLPRSGTSLVEQIISSHTEVYGGGELKFLEELVLKNFYNNNNIVNNMDNNELINSTSKQYYDKIKDFNFKEKVITDKAPLNFRWIGFIKLLFPNSKIIHCKRNPKDNCLSLFKNIFDEKLNWAYSQFDILTFYSNYYDLMNLWKIKLNKSIYEIEYEKLISEPDKEIRNLLQFCDLNWEENCLQFQNNKRPIKTVSIAQARKPLFKSSIFSYKNYENYLDKFFLEIEKKSL